MEYYIKQGGTHIDADDTQIDGATHDFSCLFAVDSSLAHKSPRKMAHATVHARPRTVLEAETALLVSAQSRQTQEMDKSLARKALFAEHSSRVSGNTSTPSCTKYSAMFSLPAALLHTTHSFLQQARSQCGKPQTQCRPHTWAFDVLPVVLLHLHAGVETHGGSRVQLVTVSLSAPLRFGSSVECRMHPTTQSIARGKKAQGSFICSKST